VAIAFQQYPEPVRVTDATVKKPASKRGKPSPPSITARALAWAESGGVTGAWVGTAVAVGLAIYGAFLRGRAIDWQVRAAFGVALFALVGVGVGGLVGLTVGGTLGTIVGAVQACRSSFRRDSSTSASERSRRPGSESKKR
jgi:hypothetical protein